MELDNSIIVLILYCVLAFLLAFYPAYLIFPKFIKKMKSLGNTGKDVNKLGNDQVARLRTINVCLLINWPRTLRHHACCTSYHTITKLTGTPRASARGGM